MATVTVNPVVLLNIADSVQRGLSRFGVLRGHATGSKGSSSSISAQVLNSFEVPLLDDGSSIDMAHIAERDELMAQIYPDEGGIIGVYAVDDAIETLSAVPQSLAQSLQVPVVLVFSPKKSLTKDGQYYRVFDVEGRELKKTVSHAGEEAVNSVLALKEPNSTEITKSKDLVDTNKEVLNIIQERNIQLISALEAGKLQSYEALREVNSLVSKLQYRADNNVKKSILAAENTYKLVQTTCVVHANTQTIEQTAADVGSRGRDQML